MKELIKGLFSSNTSKEEQNFQNLILKNALKESEIKDKKPAKKERVIKLFSP